MHGAPLHWPRLLPTLAALIPRPLPPGRLVPAALLYGLAVHWRVYPIIFALPLLRHYALQAQQAAKQPRSHAAPPGPAARARAALAAAAAGLASWRGAAFGALSGGLFLGLAGILYRRYGFEFLHETYLYHASRTDPRHNFSPYFYSAYLASAAGAGAARWDVGWCAAAAGVAAAACGCRLLLLLVQPADPCVFRPVLSPRLASLHTRAGPSQWRSSSCTARWAGAALATCRSRSSCRPCSWWPSTRQAPSLAWLGCWVAPGRARLPLDGAERALEV